MYKTILNRLRKSPAYQYLDSATRKKLEQAIAEQDNATIEKIQLALDEEDKTLEELRSYLAKQGEAMAEKLGKTVYMKFKLKKSKEEEKKAGKEEGKYLVNLLNEIEQN